MIFIQTLPFSFYYLCPMIKQLNPSIPIVVDMSDPLVINAGFHSMTVRQQKELKAIEEHCFSSIDYLIVLNKEIKDYYLQLSKPPPQVLVIEQGVVANQFMPVSQTQQKAAIENSRVLCTRAIYQNNKRTFCFVQCGTEKQRKYSIDGL